VSLEEAAEKLGRKLVTNKGKGGDDKVQQLESN
jgi:hypothetical protein